MTVRDIARNDWGRHYTEQMDAEATLLERAGCTAEDAQVASSRCGGYRDEWAGFRTITLVHAAERLAIMRAAGVKDSAA